ncbi:type IIL restriction-modification enzyme MmeI [Methanosphaera sp. ISO3-F5]|uniref:type IIL restriction-modification enzyme MmeI n=1 Tax=Methanosphaera sp. ISO3-F5 TaxID=1452353 RepID=UPI003964751D
MPPDLKRAHHKLDKEVEKIYSKEKHYVKGVFDSEMDTLKFLLELYKDKKG